MQFRAQAGLFFSSRGNRSSIDFRGLHFSAVHSLYFYGSVVDRLCSRAALQCRDIDVLALTYSDVHTREIRAIEDFVNKHFPATKVDIALLPVQEVLRYESSPGLARRFPIHAACAFGPDLSSFFPPIDLLDTVKFLHQERDQILQACRQARALHPLELAYVSRRAVRVAANLTTLTCGMINYDLDACLETLGASSLPGSYVAICTLLNIC